jgi:LemA protein
MIKKVGLIVGGCAAAFFVFILIVTVVWTAGTYNGLVNKDETIDNKWAQVANQYQRKIDLIPALIAEVEKYQEFESGTLSNITRLRTQWMDASPDEQAQTSGELDTALRSIILTYEAYPYLQSIAAVSDLMAQLEGTENRIATERMRYNDAVKEYNTEIRQFPASLIANSFGFEKRSYFETDAAPNQPGT